MLAVHSNLNDFKIITRGLALDPELISTGAPKGRHVFAQGRLQGKFIGVPNDQNLTRIMVLSDGRNQIFTATGNFSQFLEIDLKGFAFL